ncbi:hypothetical protein KRP22_012724 [Phytophthora ramorum]|nr:Vacuolar protein sorting-associated protein 13B [Phytophthora ramorum]
MAEGRRPSPGELVFTEALLIETQTAASTPSPIASTKVQIQIDPNSFDIELGDVAAYLEDCNEPWGVEERDLTVEQASLPGLGNKTHSWMEMRWCYHIPRNISTIVANPVPIPPTGIPNGWPSWGWDQEQEGEARRLCDIVCQLRCWDSKKACFVLVCEFYVPWERTPANAGSDSLEDTNEPGSFGELMSQWFDDDMEETRYRTKLLEFGSRARIFSFNNPLSSDNWELRWRSPLQSGKESENKQKRLVVNALLASSLEVHSVLDCDAYQRVRASITLPQASLSVSHVGSANDSHDIITAELNDTIISCVGSGGSHSRTLNVQVSSAVQVYLDNMAQLLTVSVIPRTTVDAMIELSSKGLEVSTLIGPVFVYLNQTSMLVMSSIPRLLQPNLKPSQPVIDGALSSMRIRIVNDAGMVENTMDIPVELSFSQKATTVNVKIAPSSEKCVSAVNPYEPVDVQLQYEQHQTSTQASRKPLRFLLECSTPAKDFKDQIFDFEGCRVIASFCDNRRPMIRLKTERILSVANMTPNILNVSIGSPLGNQGAVQKFDSCVERSVGFSVASNRLVISIATIDDPTSEMSLVEWSPEVSLNVRGDTKPIVVPPARAGLSSTASAYSLELRNSDGYLRLIVRPQVVVVNSTKCDLKCVPTDGRGNVLVDEDEPSVISGNNAGWCVPVCLHKEAKKRSITADVSSWLSSKLSRRPSEELSSASKPALMARLSCSFRVSLVEDDYEWTEEIAVLLPKIPLQLNADGKLKIIELPESSSAPPSVQDGLYPAPSTTTHRRRLLVRHRGFRHKMLTYTMTQKDKCIQIMFFVDHQPPVVVHNQWHNMLGFRNMSFPAEPEGVGPDYYLEYDWGLQVSAKQRGSKQELAEEGSDTDSKEANSESKLLSDWLEASAQESENAGMLATTNDERMRFQIGSPQYGWSNALWQVGGIQFASFTNAIGKAGPTFLVMCFYRAGSWLISITCLEDPTRDGQSSTTPSLVLPSMTTSTKTEQTVPAFLKIGVSMEELSLHFCDEYDPVRDARGMILYPEILRATCDAVSIVFATAPDPPEASRHSTRLGYLSHIRSYTTLFVAIDDIEVGHFLQTCNFPAILCFPETQASKDLLGFDRVKKHERLGGLVGDLLGKQLPGAEKASMIARVIYTDTWDPVGIPSYFHSIELKMAPAVLQVEDGILSYVNAFVRPVLDALEGEAASAAMCSGEGKNCMAPREDAWSLFAYESAVVTKQRKVYIEHFGISNIQVTITARVSIPVLNSFDGTPLHFGSTEMREVFSFPDQLYKDLAADYVADTIVRSPMLLMSLNILGNPAGFLRSFGQGVRDLVEIPLAASRNGYSPWILTKGVVGGVASFLGHATSATLTSVSGFSYSISRTMDQLTLPSDELRKRHYTRPTHLSSALADGLGSLGSSVVGAAAGVITTPIAVYKERQMQGLDTGIRSVVGGVGMGLVGIVARPMGGVASLVSLASDGLLYGMGGNRLPFDDSVSRFDARPNELLRYQLKVLPDAIGKSLIFAHGIWVVPDENKLLVAGQDLDCISKEQLDNELVRSLLLPADSALGLVQVTVVCSNDCLYVVGVSGAQNQTVLVRTSLESIQAVEESLKDPTVLNLGVKTPASAEWLRFRLPARQRRHLSHQLRLWLAEDAIL